MGEPIDIVTVRGFLKLHDARFPDSRNEGIFHGSRTLTSLECKAAELADLVLLQKNEIERMRPICDLTCELRRAGWEGEDVNHMLIYGKLMAASEDYEAGEEKP